jgi:FtsH-binding integral membrane protein
MDLLKGIVGKIVAGAVGLAVIAGGISWWSMSPATRGELVSGVGRFLSWLGVLLLVPWASFFIIGWVARFESNRAGGLLIAGYTIAEGIALAWLFGWHLHGATAIICFGAAVLLAAAYNLLICDWIAEKVFE